MRGLRLIEALDDISELCCQLVVLFLDGLVHELREERHKFLFALGRKESEFF
jgi:hypothetical protein